MSTGFVSWISAAGTGTSPADSRGKARRSSPSMRPPQSSSGPAAGSPANPSESSITSRTRPGSSSSLQERSILSHPTWLSWIWRMPTVRSPRRAESSARVAGWSQVCLIRASTKDPRRRGSPSVSLGPRRRGGKSRGIGSPFRTKSRGKSPRAKSSRRPGTIDLFRGTHGRSEKRASSSDLSRSPFQPRSLSKEVRRVPTSPRFRFISSWKPSRSDPARPAPFVAFNWIYNSSVSNHELLDTVDRFLAGGVVGLEPGADLLPKLAFAVPAEALAALARALDLGEVRIVRLEDVVVLREDRTDVRIGPEASLFLDGGPASRERVHDLLAGLGFRVRREDARFRNRGGHLAAGTQEAREELVVNQRRFRIAEFRGDVPRQTEMRVLIDPARNQHGDRVTSFDRREERGGGLEARVEDLAHVVRIREAESRLNRRERDALRDLDRDRVEVMDVLRVEEDLRQLRVEPHRDDVEYVLISDLRRIFEILEILEEELLVVSHLKVKGRVELLLQPLREEPRQHVADVDPARWPAARVERETVSLLVLA